MEPLTLGVLESFYVGGVQRQVESGIFGLDTQISGALYVQRMAPVERRFPYPVLFIHGGMHSGVTWETTPDGREGWQTLFVRGGFDTLVVDQAWRGRSPPDLTALNPFVDSGEPELAAFTCGTNIARQFARGGDRFPMRQLEHYGAQLWPDFGIPAAFAANRPGQSDPRTIAPLAQLVDRLGPVVLVTHSQGGHVGWELAKARPEGVKAIVSVEPAQTSPGLDHPDFPDITVRLMWGDNLPEEGGTLTLRDIASAREIMALRPKVSLDLLPEHGVVGNGHMLMMDDNSAQLASRVMDWFHGLGL
ncbi:Alpha/beta hydrolase family protein [Sphingobium faniae]|nr:Alpha/beta hydrolase family protein [Sphingobium faniae]